MEFEVVERLKVAAREELQSLSYADCAVEDEPMITLGIGRKFGSVEGKDDFWLSARIRTVVRQPQAEEKIRAALGKLAGDEFDLRYTGPVVPLRPFGFAARAATSRLRIGSSVSHINTLGGTLGFFARSRGDGARGFVSANHVIANLDRATPGDQVVSPSQSQRRVGELVRFTALRGEEEKFTDAAFASLGASVTVNRSSLPQGMRLLEPPAPLGESTRVMKLGARTRFTIGNVLSFNNDTFSTTAYHGLGRVDFEDQIEVESNSSRSTFASDGDSGSLVYNDRGHAVGLLFAATLGNGTHGNGLAYVNPIQRVLDDLLVDLDVT